MKYFKLLGYISKLEESTVQYRYECPNCSVVNLCYTAITDDPSYCETEGLTCWKCKGRFFFDEIFSEISGGDPECGFFDDGEREKE